MVTWGVEDVFHTQMKLSHIVVRLTITFTSLDFLPSAVFVPFQFSPTIDIPFSHKSRDYCVKPQADGFLSEHIWERVVKNDRKRLAEGCE